MVSLSIPLWATIFVGLLLTVLLAWGIMNYQRVQSLKHRIEGLEASRNIAQERLEELERQLRGKEADVAVHMRLRGVPLGFSEIFTESPYNLIQRLDENFALIELAKNSGDGFFQVAFLKVSSDRAPGDRFMIRDREVIWLS